MAQGGVPICDACDVPPALKVQIFKARLSTETAEARNQDLCAHWLVKEQREA